MSESVCAVWDFRANEDYFSLEQLLETIPKLAKKFAFQLEMGDDGYRHWQGRISLIKKRTEHPLKTVWKKLFKDILPNYLKPTSKENCKGDFFYAIKEDTRVSGPYTDKIISEESNTYLPRQYRNLILRPWQQSIKDSAEKFEDRIINLIYDPIGNNGKSTIAAICEILHGGIDMPPINDYKELIQLACNICMDTNNRTPKIMFFDMPRAVRKDQLYGLYSAIEQIKKGKLYDCRYHYKAYWIDSPQIWVFTNVMPELSMLSLDRWKIWNIKDNILVPHEEPKDEDSFL